MIKGALPPGGAFSIYSKAGIDCQPKMRKILGIPLFYIFYEYIEWKCWDVDCQVKLTHFFVES